MTGYNPENDKPKGYTPGYLSTFREGLAGLSLGEQKMIFDGLPGTFQAALWQDRLAQGMDMVDDRGQRAMLRDFRERLSAQSYSDPEINADLIGYINGMADWINQVFPDFSEFQKYTQFLGDDTYKHPVVPDDDAVPTCTCSSARSGFVRGNDCGALIECLAGGCTPTRVGCGFFWLQSCDGLCTGRIVQPKQG